jgi:hypothetical protein
MASKSSKAYRDFEKAGKPGGEANFDAWLKNAAKAGVYNPDGSPRQGMAGAKSREMEGEGHSGYNPATGQMGGIPSDTTGMRQHARQHGMSEDFDRFDEATLNLWEQYRNPDCPPRYPYRSTADPNAPCVEKPIDSGGVIQNAQGQWVANRSSSGRGGGGGGPGGRPAAPPPPPKPVTFGQQLSFTGNPMQDMLIQQFNARTALNDPTKQNIFGMGTDRQIGGEGAAADKPMMAQALAGGGLWRGSKETFGGFRADKPNAAQPGRKPGRGRRGRRGARPAAPTPQEIAAPPTQAPTPQAPTPTTPSIPEFESGIGGMMKKRYGQRMAFA